MHPALSLVLPTLLAAQVPRPALPEAMARLAPMVGTWTGEGWIRRGPGEPQRFKGREVVEARLDGRVLLVEGRHLDAQDGHPVHHAFAVISMDGTTGGYHFSSHLGDGRSGDYRAEWREGAFIWFMEIPQAGRMRYTIRIEGNHWKELGELEREGKWVPFFGMEMTRS